MAKPWLVRVDFWDHVTGPGTTPGIVECTAYGILYDETETQLNLATWITESNPRDSNSDVLFIMKSSIIRLQKICRQPL